MMSTNRPETSYDIIPYSSTAFPQSHPDRLATLAKLFGIEAAPVERCRVLELGAASGGNLIPMAYELPQSRFVGVDLSSRQIAEGNTAIDALGLTNIDLRHFSITDIGSELGLFDYIICHGVYSWVPDAVRDSILSICRGNLAPNGVAFVSYNTYPGWHMRGMIRDMMLYHAGRFSEPKAKIDQARSLLNFLATNVSVDTPYGMMLRRELDGLQRQPDSYLYHDHLEEVNSPIYFFQFAQQIEQHNLQYLGEADFSTMLSSNFQPQVAEVLQRVATDIIHMEQYMDFLRNRTFRQTLLVRRERLLHRNLTSASVKPFFIACPARPISSSPDLNSDTPEEFQTSSGLILRTAHPMTKAAMMVMAKCWPKPLHFDELSKRAMDSLNEHGGQKMHTDDHAIAVLAGEMLSAYTAGMIELRTYARTLTWQVSEYPLASSLARYQAQQDPGGRVVNLRHEPVMLDELKRQVIMRLDGDYDREALLQELIELVRSGGLNVEQNGNKIYEPSALRLLLSEAIEGALISLASMALLEK